MAHQQIKLNYCAQCKQIDKESVYNCRWLQFNFCHLMCLKQFYLKLATECDLCKKSLDLNRIHVRDDIKSNDNTFHFICDQCFDRRSSFAVHCHCCQNVCYKGFGAQIVTESGLISKFICSSECQKKVVHSLIACCECGIQQKCDPILYDNKIDAICVSSVCLANFKLKYGNQIDECDKCLTKFINSVKHEYVIIDGGIRKSFCRAQCMNAHVRQDTNIVVCCNCQHRQQYYSSIRRSCDKRCFCSIHCAIAGETGIEQLVQNDERSYLAILNLKCSTYDSELKSNESFEDYISLDESITATDHISTNIYASPVDELFNSKTDLIKVETDSSQFKITLKILTRLTTAPIFQPLSYASKCCHCRCDIRLVECVVQWEFLEFCSITCYEGFILSNNYNCALCTADYDAYNHVVSTCIVGNRLYLFCSEHCAKDFFSLNLFCKFCRSISASANHNFNGFCQIECQRRFHQLYETSKNEEILCSQCQLNKVINKKLLIGNELFKFCSHSCFFYQTVICGIVPEQCTICQLYFVCEQSNLSYKLHHNQKLHVFCSQSCMSHFIYKYQFLEMCSLCHRQKSNFNMIKLIVNGTTIQVNYCSMQCLQIVEQSIALEQAFQNS